MPATSPGSLSEQDYLYVLSFLLVQNDYVSADTIVDEATLNNISLN
jgi:hypothetical protein